MSEEGKEDKVRTLVTQLEEIKKPYKDTKEKDIASKREQGVQTYRNVMHAIGKKETKGEMKEKSDINNEERNIGIYNKFEELYGQKWNKLNVEYNVDGSVKMDDFTSNPDRIYFHMFVDNDGEKERHSSSIKILGKYKGKDDIEEKQMVGVKYSEHIMDPGHEETGKLTKITFDNSKPIAFKKGDPYLDRYYFIKEEDIEENTKLVGGKIKKTRKYKKKNTKKKNTKKKNTKKKNTKKKNTKKK